MTNAWHAASTQTSFAEQLQPPCIPLEDDAVVEVVAPLPPEPIPPLPLLEVADEEVEDLSIGWSASEPQPTARRAAIERKAVLMIMGS